MTDRELLELAAKAAGIAATAYYGPSDEFWGLVVDSTGVEWNPLADDGDALRLAVQCGILVSQQCSYVATQVPHGGVHVRGVQWNEYYNGDPCAATRLAIVRAAAAIGAA